MKPKMLLAADFETTVYDGQKDTEVWLGGYAELFSDERVVVRGSIQSVLADFFM